MCNTCREDLVVRWRYMSFTPKVRRTELRILVVCYGGGAGSTYMMPFLKAASRRPPTSQNPKSHIEWGYISGDSTAKGRYEITLRRQKCLIILRMERHRVTTQGRCMSKPGGRVCVGNLTDSNGHTITHREEQGNVG